MAVLTYHVVPGKIMAGDVVTTDAKTVNGKKLPVTVDAEKVKAGKANVVKTDSRQQWRHPCGRHRNYSLTANVSAAGECLRPERSTRFFTVEATQR